MKNEKGFSFIEIILICVVVGMFIVIPPYISMTKKSNASEIRNNNTNNINYNDYTKKCIKGQTYIVSKNGDVRQILNENKDPVVCESKEKIGILEEDMSHTVEVNANPYKNQE